MISAGERPDGVPRVSGRAVADPDRSLRDVAAGLGEYGCCVITEVADACDAWPALLSAARQVHALDEASRYQLWRGVHGTWRGYEPSKTAAERIAATVDVDPAFLAVAEPRRFSAFDVGPLWPVAGDVGTAGILDGTQPWPKRPGFAQQVTQAFAATLDFGVDLVRRVLASEPLAGRATVPPFDAPCASMRLLHYEATQTIGGQHLDYEALTMIQSDASGLEVQDSSGQWRRPLAGPDDLILMAGDLLEAVTNGAVGAALHRVTAETERHAAIVFVGADYGFDALMPATGNRMAFGQFLEGMLVRTTANLWSDYQAGTLTVPYPLPEPNPFKGEPWMSGVRAP